MTPVALNIDEIGDLTTRVGINGAFQNLQSDSDSLFELIVGIVAETNTVPAQEG